MADENEDESSCDEKNNGGPIFQIIMIFLLLIMIGLSIAVMVLIWVNQTTFHFYHIFFVLIIFFLVIL